MMRKILIICFAIGFFNTASYSQETDSATIQRINDLEERMTARERADSIRNVNEHLDKIWKQKKHLTVGYAFQKLRRTEDADETSLKSDFAMSLQWGKTFSFHKTPIANMVKIGLDWNWVDWHYAKYKEVGFDDMDASYDEAPEVPSLNYQQIELGMAIGPSVQVTPLYTIGKGLEHLKVYTFFHVTPCWSAIIQNYDGETELAGVANTFFSWGIGIAYKSIAVGFETRWAKAKYKNLLKFEEDMEDVMDSFVEGSKVSYKTTASKLTLSLRF